MGFSIAQNPVWKTWEKVHYGSGGAATVYQGSIVSQGLATPADNGVQAIGAAAGASDTTGKAIPYGIVLSTDDYEPTYTTTGSYIASVQSQAAQVARNHRGGDGKFAKGDPAAKVEVSVLGPHSVISGPIYNAAYGTAPSVVTVTTGSTTGAGFTATACDFTPVAYNYVAYCRSGANKGLWRVGYDTSATVHTFYDYFPYDIAIGDTFVLVNIRPGTCRAQFDALSTYVEVSAALTADYYLINVVDFHLNTPGEETVLFTFNADQFCGARA